MYLLDTNIWLERLLGQENFEDVGKLLGRIPPDQIFLTDFSFHSICIVLLRYNQAGALLDFIDDIVIEGQVTLLTCPPEQIALVVDVIETLGLDFDDGYQYVIAEQNNLVIVSLDRDFDRTPLGRKTPAEILAETNQA